MQVAFVNLPKRCTIYTRQGDSGQTSLVNQQRVSKGDPRIEAYGLLDEFNAYLGWMSVAIPSQAETKTVMELCYQIQQSLFNLGASLLEPPKATVSEISSKDVEALEESMDALNAHLPPLKTFILPGSGECSARVHLVRAFCRRLERHLVILNEQPDVNLQTLAIPYINRLSDWFFVVARYISLLQRENEQHWQQKTDTL